jgi:hypothetical protein
VDADDDGDAIVVWEQHDTHTNWRIAAQRVSRSSPRSTTLASGSDPRGLVEAAIASYLDAEQ